MTERVIVQPGSEVYAALDIGVKAGEPLLFEVVPAWSERRFEKGDRVEICADDGSWMPAEVLSASAEYVSVTYGTAARPTKWRFQTSLSRGAVRTKNVIQHPATIRVSVVPNEEDD